MKKVLENNYNLTDVEIIKNIKSTDGNLREQLKYCVDDSISKITDSYTEEAKQKKDKKWIK